MTDDAEQPKVGRAALASGSMLAQGPKHDTLVGWFQHAWANAELAVDCAVGRLLRISDEETHLLTAGLEFNRKATLVRALIRRSSHKNKSQIGSALNIMQNESKRNVFAHSYLEVRPDLITYIERKRGGDFKVERHTFTVEEFRDHVFKFVDAVHVFISSMELSDEELRNFADAAFNVVSKA